MKHKGLSVFLLTMLITGAIDSIRNLPATALFGTELIFFFVLAAVLFLIPIALVSAELSATWTEKGGVYYWVQRALGEKMAFLAIWLQWINTMVWYPTILSFIAGTLAFLIDPSLAQNKAYLITVILVVFWLQTFINLFGVETSAKFASVCAVFGTFLPMFLLIGLGIFWISLGKPLQIHFTLHNSLPDLHHGQSWISLTAIMAAFLGMELASVHVNHVDNPQRNFPKALTYSVTLILTTMILGSLAIAFIIPKHQIGLVDGVMELFSRFFHGYHMGWAVPVLTVMLLVGALGGMVNWVISPAKGLLQAARHDFLPHFLQKQNKYGVAQNLLLTQAVLVSLLCFAFSLMPSVNGWYWLFTDLSTQLYLLMYLLVFVSAIVLRYKFADIERPFKIRGGKFGIWVTSLLGIAGCLLTLCVGFFPPDGINVGTAAHYETVFSIGLVSMIVPVFAFYLYRKVNTST